MGHVGEWVNGSWVWKLKWRREWFTWETLLVCDLMREMEGVRLKQCTCDEVVWKSSSTVFFSVNSAYNIVTFDPNFVEKLFYKHLWKLFIPKKKSLGFHMENVVG